MIRAASVFAVALLAACETRVPGADSAVATPLDSANPVVVNAVSDSARRADSLRVADSLARAAASKTKSRPATATPTPPTGSKTDSTKGHPNIGRDSVIRRPRQIPADTTTRP